MSDGKQGLGLFVSAAKSRAAPAASALGGPSGPPKDVKKRWMYVGAGVVSVVVLGGTLLAPAPVARVMKEKEAAMVNVTPPGADKAAFESRFAQDQAQMREALDKMSNEISRLQANQRNQGDASSPGLPPSGITPPPSMPGANTGGLGTVGANGALGTVTGTPPSPPTPPADIFKPGGTPPVPTIGSGDMPLPGMTGVTGVAGDPPVSFDAPVLESSYGEGSSATAKVQMTKNSNAGTMSVGFAPVALLNGVDAGTSTSTQSNPLPVLLNITDHATLPGSAKYNLKSCFALGTAYGDLSAERVYARVSRISCVDKKDRLALNAEVQGYVVDSDGKLGLRGLISDRQGPRLAKAMLAGFAQGLAGALGSAQGTVMSNLTSGDTTSSISGAAALRASGLTGAQTATAQLAEFYLKEAQSIFPVISVDVGRVGTVIFTSPVRLEWANTENQYVPKVTPLSSK